MANNCTKDRKLAIIIRTYLLLKNEPVTAKQISEFINYDFKLHDHVTKQEVVVVINKHSKRLASNLLEGICVVKGYPNKYYLES